MAAAALGLHEATGEADTLAQAERWVALLDRHYWDDATGGCFLTADDTPDLIVRTKTAYDSAVPSGNGVMLGVLARLHYLTGKAAYRERAETLASAFRSEEHTSELQSLMRISYAVFCLNKNTSTQNGRQHEQIKET